MAKSRLIKRVKRIQNVFIEQFLHFVFGLKGGKYPKFREQNLGTNQNIT